MSSPPIDMGQCDQPTGKDQWCRLRLGHAGPCEPRGAGVSTKPFERLKLTPDGEPSHWLMSRAAWRATHPDFKSPPHDGRGPTRLALDPRSGGTWSVPVTFTCEHGVPEVTRCTQCVTEEPD